MESVSVRYIVNDVDVAIDFYCGQLGFHEDAPRTCLRHAIHGCSCANGGSL
ncbi:MAG: hypothetical protein M0005_10970 [Actinomycetota bacterium]|nr:hypothetical protein [Actinomycetota bacterium]